MPKAIRLYECGGPDRLRWEEQSRRRARSGRSADPPDGGGRELHRCLHAHRPVPAPAADGNGVRSGRRCRGRQEGACAISRSAIASPITSMSPAPTPSNGVMPADELVKLPAYISDEQAAAVMLKGLTAWFLVRECFKVRRGTVLLLTAAAGGVGLILGAMGARARRPRHRRRRQRGQGRDRAAARLQPGAGRL